MDILITREHGTTSMKETQKCSFSTRRVYVCLYPSAVHSKIYVISNWAAYFNPPKPVWFLVHTDSAIRQCVTESITAERTKTRDRLCLRHFANHLVVLKHAYVKIFGSYKKLWNRRTELNDQVIEMGKRESIGINECTSFRPSPVKSQRANELTLSPVT